MAERTLQLTDELHRYVVDRARESEVLRKHRLAMAEHPRRSMQVAPDEGAFLALLVRLTRARRCLEIGTFTGYSSTAVALALPPDGTVVCCDVSREWTDIARTVWADAGVAHRIDLRVGPAVETLDSLLASDGEGTFDFAFIDADKPSYDAYYERCLRLVRRGGLIAIDNTLWDGKVVDPAPDDRDTRAIATLNDKIAADERVDAVLLPLADGVTLARVR
jgi:predicted O-methyltransferase YrrM